MRILFAGNKTRGVRCLEALVGAGHTIVTVLAHPVGRTSTPSGSVADAAATLGLPVLRPASVGDEAVLAALRETRPDVTVLAGYGPIVQQPFIDLAPLGCINLHAGKLPEYRGSSPLNWALINGESDFTLSIIRVDRGVDTGDVLAERTFPIGPDDTVVDLERIANDAFPSMLLDVVSRLSRGPLAGRRQQEDAAGYFPLRFPEDGFIAWDLLSARQVHDRIRALADPFPGAFTFLRGRRVRLLQSALPDRRYFGTPGRIYRIGPRGLLVCASDRCLWVRRAVFEETGEDVQSAVQRYEKFLTVTDSVLAQVARGAGHA